MLNSRASYVAAPEPSISASDSATLDEEIARLEVCTTITQKIAAHSLANRLTNACACS